MTDNPFALLEAASNELKGLKEIDALVEFRNILERINSSILTILNNSSLISIYIYQLLRFLQQINYSVILISLEQEKPKPLLQILTAQMISTLKRLLAGSFDIGDVCGREFLRFSLDHSLVSEFSFSTEIKDLAKPPKNEFIKTLIPKNIQDEIDESLVGEDCSQTIQNLQSLLNQNCPETIHFLICDIIRYTFAAKRLTVETKTEFIKSLLTLIPNWKETIYTFEICIVLIIDIITYQRQLKLKEDEINIRVIFNLIREFPLLLKFIERLVEKDQLMILFLAEAAAKCSETNLFVNITLPTVEPEEPKIDTKAALNELLSKLKWQRKSDGGTTLITDFASQVIHNLQPCYFEIPFKPSEDLQIILDSGNANAIASVCELDQNVFKTTIYALSDKKELVENIIDILVKTEAKSFMLQSFSKVLVIAPHLLRTVIKFLPQIPNNIDPTPFIRYMSYNLTNDEIIQILNFSSNIQNSNSFYPFPSDDETVESLIKSSLNWKETAQTTFWMIIVNTAINRDPTNAKNLINAIEKLLPQIANFPVVFIQIRMMLQKMQPSPLLSKLANSFMKGNEKICEAFAIIIAYWFQASQDDTIAFLQNRFKSFKEFFVKLSDENKKKVPDLLRQKMFAIQ